MLVELRGDEVAERGCVEGGGGGTAYLPAHNGSLYAAFAFVHHTPGALSLSAVNGFSDYLFFDGSWNRRWTSYDVQTSLEDLELL